MQSITIRGSFNIDEHLKTYSISFPELCTHVYQLNHRSIQKEY